MRDCLLRRQQGLRPYARAKAFAASRLTGARYPKIRNNFECAPEVAILSPYDEIENVAARSAAEAIKDFPFGMNVERRVPFGVEWAQADVLPTGATKPTVLARDAKKITVGFNSSRVERTR